MDSIVQEITKKYWKSLKKKKNVIGYSGVLHNKIRSGKEFKKRPSFRIYVTRKESKEILGIKNLVPQMLKLSTSMIETDIIEIGEIKALEVCRNRNRPIKAGCSAMNGLVNGACTLGWFAKNKKAGEEEFFGVVDNCHCGGRENNAKRGEPYIYPSMLDGGNVSNDTICEHWRHYELKFDSFTCPTRNFFYRFYKVLQEPVANPVDSSFERLIISLSEVSFKIFKIGDINGKRRGTIGEIAEKVGRTTGHTTGAKLIDNDWYGLVQYSRGPILRGPCGLLDGKGFCAGGDSSSAIRWIKDKNLPGLLFGGSDTTTVFDHYDLIEKYLEVELYVNK